MAARLAKTLTGDVHIQCILTAVSGWRLSALADVTATLLGALPLQLALQVDLLRHVDAPGRRSARWALKTLREEKRIIWHGSVADEGRPFLWKARLGALCQSMQLCRPGFHDRATFWSLGRPPSLGEAYECEIRLLRAEHLQALEQAAEKHQELLFKNLRSSIKRSVPGVNSASYPSSSEAVLAGMRNSLLNPASGEEGEAAGSRS